MRVNKVLNTTVEYNHEVNKICNDSRQVQPNDIFFAISGSNSNGEEFIEEAIKKGAKTIVTEHYDFDFNFYGNIVIVKNARKELAYALRRFFKSQLKKTKIIGVTGTNGKTTTTTLVYRYLRHLNIGCSLIGSNGNYVNDIFYETNNTTPDITQIYQIIEKSVNEGCKYLVLEVSSHAIKQLRVMGLRFSVVLFTNLTLDHLDFHLDFTDYKYTKGMFLSQVSEKDIVILNRDSEYFDFYNHLTKAKLLTYGFNDSDYWIHNVDVKEDASKFTLVFNKTNLMVTSNLIGMFNVYNLTSFIAIIDALKLFDLEGVLSFLKKKLVILGRMEEITFDSRRVIIDYAHTPDGVFNVLSFLKTLNRNIILVVGCGGSRDKTKRTVIGQISVDNSDYVIFTSDNPRDEDEMSIINDIIVDIEKENYEVVVDRYLAIKRAIEISQPNDIIAILGRGNEQFQKVKDQLIPLHDKAVVEEILRGRT